MAASLDELYNIVHQESIMKTSIIGYPRVGSLRELKFTTEKYFRGEISVEELQNIAKEIRKPSGHYKKYRTGFHSVK